MLYIVPICEDGTNCIAKVAAGRPFALVQAKYNSVAGHVFILPEQCEQSLVAQLWAVSFFNLISEYVKHCRNRTG